MWLRPGRPLLRVRGSSVILLAAATLVLVPRAVAQTQVLNVGYATSKPAPAAGHDYLHGLDETVDPGNGSVSLVLKVPVPKGRGLTLPFSIRYSSDGVVLNNGGWTDNHSYLDTDGWSYSVPRVTEGADEEVSDSSGDDCIWVANFMFDDPMGSGHPLGLSPAEWNAGPADACQVLEVSDITSSTFEGGVATTTDGAPFAGWVNVVDAGGTNYYFPSFAAATSTITDSNGNVVNVNDAGQGKITYTDTLGRTLINTSGYGTGSQSISVSGLSSPYNVTWGSIAYSYALNISLVWSQDPPYISDCAFGGSGRSRSVVQSITLPDGRQYSFQYEGTYGLISKVTFPGGGYIRYVWGNNTQSDFAYYSNQGAYTSNPWFCAYHVDTPALTGRYVSFDGTHEVLHQSFAYQTTWGDLPPFTGPETRMTLPPLAWGEGSSVRRFPAAPPAGEA